MSDDNRFNHNSSSPQGDPATSERQPQAAYPKRPQQNPAGPPPQFTPPEAGMRAQPRQAPPPPVQQNWMRTPPGPAHMPPGARSSPVSGGNGPYASQQQTKKNYYLLIGSLLVLSILLEGAVFAVWWFMKSTPDVTLYQVGSQNANQDIGGGGIIFPRQQLDISYPTSELVKAVLVKPGDQVTPNQSLIQLDASLLNIQIQQAAADTAAAQATLRAVEASGNQLQIAQAQQAYQFAKDRYNAMVAQAQSPTLHNGNLIAPMSGVVTAVNVNPGAVIVANVPLVTIMDESTVIVHAKIPLSNLGGVQLGQQAIVTPSALPNVSMQGTVTSIIPQADPQTDTFEVWVSVINPNRELLPGMSAFVHLQSMRKALVVPRLAVLDPESHAAVFVVQDVYAHLQRVQVVGRTVDTIFIGQGLKAGDKVVLVGLNGLQNNQRVRVSGIEQNTASS
jgi:RND family efflux transporter MFP subunit